MLLLVLSLESYPAYSRVFVARLASHLRIAPRVISEEEGRIAGGLSNAASSVYNEEGLIRKADDGRKDKRGRATAAGGQTTPPTLAPAMNAAKIGSLPGGSSICPAATATVIGTMGTLSDGGLATCMFFGVCGPRGSPAKTFDAYTKDVQDVSLLPLHCEQKLEIRESKAVPPEYRRLRLSISINGWLMDKDDCIVPWRVLNNKSEAYTLRWELETLTKIGASLDTVMRSMAWQNAKKEFANRSGLLSKPSLPSPPPQTRLLMGFPKSSPVCRLLHGRAACSK